MASDNSISGRYRQNAVPALRRRINAHAPMAGAASGLTTGTLNTGSSLTPQGAWDSMFRNLVTGETPSSLAAARKTGGYRAVSNAIDSLTEDPSLQSEGYVPGMKKSPSLSVLSAGGTTHTQRWGGDSLGQQNNLMTPAPFMPKMPSIPQPPPTPTGLQSGVVPTASSKYVTPGTTPSVSFDQQLAKSFGWGSAGGQ